MTEARWTRLADSLTAAGVEATVESRPYPGGISRSITIRTGDALIEIHDKWWRDSWIGWQVHIEGRRDSIVRRSWPRTKNRGEVVAAVLSALSTTNQETRT